MTVRSRIELDPVSVFRGWEPDDLKAVRRRLLKARNIAAARAVSCNVDDARREFWDVNDIAGRWWIAHASVTDLTAIANAMVRKFQVASTLEQVGGVDV